jgi:hypothetical protein
LVKNLCEHDNAPSGYKKGGEVFDHHVHGRFHFSSATHSAYILRHSAEDARICKAGDQVANLAV